MGLKTTNAADNTPIMWLYGVIGDDYGGITANEFRQELADIPKKSRMELHIHSEGGSFWDGVAIHNQLSQRKGVSVVIDGLAASAASLIAMAGDTIEMPRHSWMMIHEVSSIAIGRAADFREAADRMDVLNGEIVSIYGNRWSGTEEELRAALNAETWMTAEEALERGLADTLSESMAEAAHFDPSRFKYSNVPEAVLKAANEFPRLRQAEDVISELETILGGE